MDAGKGADFGSSQFSGSGLETPGGGTGGSRRKMWLRLSVALLVLTTPVALWQTWRHIDWLGLKKAYWLFEPTIAPPGSELTHFEDNIQAVAHSDTAVWIGGDGGLLAYSENEGKSWTCLALANGSWQRSDCLTPRPKLSDSVVAIQWFDEQNAILLTRAANDAPAATVADTVPLESQVASPGLNRLLNSNPIVKLTAPPSGPQFTVRVSVYRTHNGGANWTTDISPIAPRASRFALAGGVLSKSQVTSTNLAGVTTFLYPQSFPECSSVASSFQPGVPSSNALQQISPACVVRPYPLTRWFLKKSDQHSVWVMGSQYPDGHAITAVNRTARISLRLPPPWYLFIALPFAAFLLLLALRERTDVLPPLPDSIANMGVSDRPIDWNDTDAMGFHAMARGISLFLRNANTGLPLVLAVNGRWGSGKSSLMNLLRENMRNSASTVWFNAWHHQSEEQLLAALLQAVRLQSLESMWSLEGLGRRGKLLVIRLKAIWPVATLLSGIGILLILFIAETIQKLAQPIEVDASHATAVFKHWAGLVSSLVALAGVLKKLKESVGSLIANPASLLASSSGSGKLSDLNAQTTFRDRFSKDFEKLIDVMGDRRLVIIIDDLDRCRPEKLRDILEAINFLVSSGNCAIILGLARLNVEHFLGYSFKDFVTKMPFELLEVRPEGYTEDGKPQLYTEDDKPRLYARLYLEKLIQIEVTVPPMTEAQARAMIAREAPNPQDEIKEDETIRAQRAKQLRMVEMLRAFFRTADRWGTPVVGSLLLAFILYLPLTWTKDFLVGQIERLIVAGEQQPKASQGNPGTPGAEKAQSPAPGPGINAQRGSDSQVAANSEGANLAGATQSQTVTTVASPAPNPAQTNPPQSAPIAIVAQRAYEIPGWLAVACECLLTLAFLLGLLRLMLTKIESQVVHDSPAFERALERWVPLIRGIFKSPRALKRYVNKVRFLAMRQRGIAEVDQAPMIDRLAKNFAKRLYPAPEKDPIEVAVPIVIPDDVLILLVALEGDAILWRLLTQHAEQLESGSLDEVFQDRLRMESQEISSQIKKAWPQLRRHLDRYLVLAGRIVVT